MDKPEAGKPLPWGPVRGIRDITIVFVTRASKQRLSQLPFSSAGDALTMDDGGSEANDGIGVIPRVIRDLFDGLDERREVWDVVVTCSFFELYNEEINDLFAKVSSAGALTFNAHCSHY